MSVSDSLRSIAAVVDALEAGECSVIDVSDGDPEGTEEGVALRLAAEVSLFEGVAPDGVEVRPTATRIEDGRPVVELAVVAGDGAAGEPQGSTGGDAAGPADGETTDGQAADGETAGGDGPGGEATPVHRDPDRLRAVYEEHDSFPAMTEALGADVTPQTVRRQMIEHGIHIPGSGDAEPGDAGAEDGTDEGADPGGGDGRGEATETRLADGIDLPEGVDLEGFKEVVRSARTVHEAGRELGVDHERARRLLRELDLLDLVSGRIDDEREVSREEIDERVRGASPTGA